MTLDLARVLAPYSARPSGNRERIRFQFWLTPLSTETSLWVHQEKISWHMFRGSFETRSGEGCVRRGVIEAIREILKERKKDVHAKLAPDRLTKSNVKMFRMKVAHNSDKAKNWRTDAPCANSCMLAAICFLVFKSSHILLYPSLAEIRVQMDRSI